MDKIKVNTQVVTMRKFVKQAKIHVINRCAKQIKFLENRKGNEEQMAKTKRKLQRLLEEVKILKTMKPDSVSKLALSKAKDWKAVLSEKNLPLEDRCFAMLANHPPVQESVEKFHTDNTDLISKIPELVKEWEEKKSRRSLINQKKHKGNQDDAKNPNKLPIGKTNNFPKSNRAEVKRQSTASLENQPDSSDLKSFQNNIVEQNLDIKKITSRKNSSDNIPNNFDSSSPVTKKLLVADNAKGNESDDCLSDSSDTASHQGSHSKNELPVKDQTKSDHPYENESEDSLSDNSDISNHQSSQSKEKSPVKDRTKSDQSFENDSDDSLSDSSDVITHWSSQSKKKLPVKDKTKKDQSCKSGNIKETKIESNDEENSGKLPDIRSKFLEISMSKTKMQNKPRNKPLSVVHQLNAGVESNDDDDDGSAGAFKKLDNGAHCSSTKTKPSLPSKPETKSKIKAITMLDLNELQDVDEIPIEKSDSDSEDETEEETGKQKKDPFFLCDGEVVSESDDESAGKKTARKQDFLSFKNKPYGNFNRRERRQQSFQNRQFNQHSVNGKDSNFREKSFVKNKESSFKDNKRSFKQAFDGNSEYRQNKKESSFKDNKRSFNQAFDGSSEYRQNKKFQFASKDKFGNRNSTNNFTKNPKEKSFSQNYDRDVTKNSYPPKNNPSNFTPKVKPDDKPLHPSWEAKRKLKEAANVKFQGKRMVFKD